MKVIIVGAGRLGLGLAQKLDAKGNHVILIDKNPDALKGVYNNFKGETIVGIGFDKDILEKANVHMVDAVVACTDVDETNALIARICRTIYKVPRAIARLYDARKATIYNALGVQVISPTQWGIQHATELLSYSQLDTVLDIGSSSVEIIRVEMPALMAGMRVRDINRPGEVQVVAIRRENKAKIPTDGTNLEKDDVFYAAVAVPALKTFKNMLGLQ